MYGMYCLVFLFIIFVKSSSSFNSMLGPSDFIFKVIEDCPDVEQKRGIEIFLTQRKYNRTTHVFDVDLETEYDLSDALTIECKGALKKEGGYKQGSFLMKKQLCEAFHVTLRNVFDDFLNATGFTDCPITAGSYHIRDFYFDNENFDVPQLYGEYKMEFNIWKDDELIRCINGYYEFIPKQS